MLRPATSGQLAFTTLTAGLIFWHHIRRSSSTIRAPTARKIPVKLSFGKITGENRGENCMDPPRSRNDNYFWLRDETRVDDKVIKHLTEENDYCSKRMSHMNDFQAELYQEMLSHLKETDEDVPYKYGPYYYYSSTEKGKSYKKYCRKLGISSQQEEIILDENVLAEGHAYIDVGCVDPSPSHNLLAYAIDTTGYETYSLKIRDLGAEGIELHDVLEGISSNMAWGLDDSFFFYTTLDEEQRPYKVWIHKVGTEQSEDICIYTEDDPMFWLGLHKSASEKFLFFGVESKETSESYVINLQEIDIKKNLPDIPIYCIEKRRFGIRYEVEHHSDYFYLVTNENGAKNNKLMRCPVTDILRPDHLFRSEVEEESVLSVRKEDVRPYLSNEQIENILPFEKFIAVIGRKDGIPNVWIIPSTSTSTSTWDSLKFNEEDYSVWFSDNCVYESECLRIGYSSFITPKQILDYNINTKTFIICKQQEVPYYDISQYICIRKTTVVRDGTHVPISMVCHKNIASSIIEEKSTVARPTILYGYGSYGMSIDPSFDFKRVALLDRGVVYVIAHIRGGGEMGRHWYEDEGKYLTKMNTFNDFIDVGKFLIATGVSDSQHLGIVGRSAGGLLIGASINLCPEIFKAAVADVPFVDVLNTMSDPTIPLTVTEWEEWGNPNEEKYYEYMASYSPYDNIFTDASKYPALLVTAGLNDPRVPYWEPAKLVAKMREFGGGTINPIYLKTDLSSGHFSASDRYKYIKETAFEYSFLLEQLDALSPLKKE